jgi:hypothetical protein
MIAGTQSQAPELVVAAGILEGAGALNDRLTLKAATERLRELLSPAALWTPDTLPPSRTDEPEMPLLGHVPRWQPPDAAIPDPLAGIVLSAWNAAVLPPQAGLGGPVLRLEVPDAEAAGRLAGLGKAGPYLIVPCITGRHAREFAWRWPMRIGVARGPAANRWNAELEVSRYASFYDVRVMEPDDADPIDILFVDVETASRNSDATCIVVAGGTGTTAKRFSRGRDESRAAIVIGSASADLGWFEGVVREMAHDRPLDVALRVASPDSLIAADTNLLQYTAVRQWALAMAEKMRESPDDGTVRLNSSHRERLHHFLAGASFTAESGGAAGVVDLFRTLDTQGFKTELRIRMAMAMALPPAPAAQPAQAPAPAVAVKARRLIANARAGGRICARTLLPDEDHELYVQIAIPRKWDASSPVDFPDESLPRGTVVELMVNVTSVTLGLCARQPVVLSTANRSAPSTIAVFRFHTRDEGTVVDIKILVTFRERPLQECHYVATVRSRPVAGDEVRINPVPLSGSPEPRPDATPAQLSLEVNGGDLVRTGSSRAIDLDQVRGTLDDIEQTASRVLADDNAPEKLTDRPAEELLVSLARAGASLKKYLAPIEIGNSKTISLLVDVSTPVLPIELAYDAPTPEIGARLCKRWKSETLKGKPKRCKAAGNPGACGNAGKKVVCPYAFWGQERVIARTIRLAGSEAERREPEPLDLRPILYAAAARADRDVPAGPKPSDALEAELKEIAGASAVVRVGTWAEWKRQVRKTHPQLLVVLGHVESEGQETLLEIGDKSWLRDPDIDAGYLCGKDSPPPLVVLLACSSALARNAFGGLPSAFTGGGAAAVVGTLTQLHGPHGARAAAAVVRALCGGGAPGALKLGSAMTAARRALIEDGLLIGLLLVSHGEIDLPLNR